jgi:hypothetical protein
MRLDLLIAAVVDDGRNEREERPGEWGLTIIDHAGDHKHGADGENGSER